MRPLAQVRAEQDLVLRDSLAGSSLSALTVVVGFMLLSLVTASPDGPLDPPAPGPGEEPPVDHSPKNYVPAPIPMSDAFVVVVTEKEPEPPAIEDPPPVPGDAGGSAHGLVASEPGLVGGGGGDLVVREPVETIPPPTEFIWYEEMPVSVRRVSPEYPPVLRDAGLEGTVTVRLFVGMDGRVKRAEIEGRKSSAFDEAALAAVRQWVFTPAKANGKPVGVWMRVPVVFTLD